MKPEIRDAMLALKSKLVDPHAECGGTGWLDPITPGRPNPCKCMVIFHYLNALIESRIPQDYWSLGIDDLDGVEDSYKKLCRWYTKRLEQATSHALGLLFLGPNGIGKTSMQCAIGKEAVVQGYSVRYFTAQQYIESRKMDDEDSHSAEYEDAKIILLDELDKVYIKAKSNFVVKTLEDFFRRKTSDGSCLIICTNHDEGTLEEVFGQSTMSMLRRHLKFINVEGGDYSDTLQTRWDTLMESERDYFSDSIMTMAQRLTDREQSEDDRGYETN
jgi:DNA replication protein DnaC